MKRTNEAEELFCQSCNTDLTNIKSPFLEQLNHCPACGTEVQDVKKQPKPSSERLETLAQSLEEWRRRALKAEAHLTWLDIKMCEILDIAGQRWRWEGDN